MTINIVRYAADGHAGEPAAEKIVHIADTLEDARAWIVRRVGNHGQWTDESGQECWHESDAEGCGGYCIEAEAAE